MFTHQELVWFDLFIVEVCFLNGYMNNILTTDKSGLDTLFQENLLKTSKLVNISYGEKCGTV